jgi:hypothetical protein
MLRGAIEQAGPHVVSGWAYSADADISGRMILVFEGTTCLGAGRIGIDRPDLRDAGLGHGRYGFRVPIPPQAGQAPLYLKLEGSDAILLPPGVRLAPAVDDRRIAPAEIRRTVGRYAWMCGRGWIGHAYLDFVKLFMRAGHYEMALARPTPEAAAAAAALTLSDFFLEEVRPASRPIDGAGDLAALLAGLAGPVGLAGPAGATLRVVEGSHVALDRDAGDVDVVAEYALDPWRVVWVHPAAEVTLCLPGGGRAAVFARPPESARPAPPPGRPARRGRGRPVFDVPHPSVVWGRAT